MTTTRDSIARDDDNDTMDASTIDGYVHDCIDTVDVGVDENQDKKVKNVASVRSNIDDDDDDDDDGYDVKSSVVSAIKVSNNCPPKQKSIRSSSSSNSSNSSSSNTNMKATKTCSRKSPKTIYSPVGVINNDSGSINSSNSSNSASVKGVRCKRLSCMMCDTFRNSGSTHTSPVDNNDSSYSTSSGCSYHHDVDDNYCYNSNYDRHGHRIIKEPLKSAIKPSDLTETIHIESNNNTATSSSSSSSNEIEMISTVFSKSVVHDFINTTTSTTSLPLPSSLSPPTQSPFSSSSSSLSVLSSSSSTITSYLRQVFDAYKHPIHHGITILSLIDICYEHGYHYLYMDLMATILSNSNINNNNINNNSTNSAQSHIITSPSTVTITDTTTASTTTSASSNMDYEEFIRWWQSNQHLRYIVVSMMNDGMMNDGIIIAIIVLFIIIINNNNIMFTIIMFTIITIIIIIIIILLCSFMSVEQLLRRRRAMQCYKPFDNNRYGFIAIIDFDTLFYRLCKAKVIHTYTNLSLVKSKLLSDCHKSHRMFNDGDDRHDNEEVVNYGSSSYDGSDQYMSLESIMDWIMKVCYHHHYHYHHHNHY